MQQVTAGFAHGLEAQCESGAGAVHLAAVACQHAVLAQQLKQLARQGGMEIRHRAVLHCHPFGVGARHAQDAAAPRQFRLQPQRAQYLNLFAAHHIRPPITIVAAQARRDGDGAALLAVADRMAERSLAFDNALQDLGTLLHRVALVQAIPSAVAEDDPERAMLANLAVAFSAEEIQLLYQIALQGRQDIGYAPDDYAGFTMTLMRMLAFVPAGVADTVARKPAVAAPNRPQVAPPATSETSAKKKTALEGDWTSFIAGLPLAGMERMLAHNCELVSWQDGRLELRVAHAQRHLNSRAYQDRLQQVLEQNLGTRIKLEITVGAVDGKTVAAVRDREEKQQLSAAASAIESDPFVRDVIEHFDGRVVPESIKPTP